MIKSYFFNAVETEGTYDREYDAEDFASYLDKLVSNGVFPLPETSLQVNPGSGLNLVVSAGQGWINGHKAENTADYNIALPAADQVNPRIDRVVLYLDETAREMGISILQGVPAASPSAPELTRTSTRWELCLAQIDVAKNATSITKTNILDTRGEEKICGFVRGLVKPQLSVTRKSATFTTSTASVSQINVLELMPEFEPSVDILEVYISGLKLLPDEFSESDGVVTLATPVTHANTVIEFVVTQSATANIEGIPITNREIDVITES